MPSATSHSGSGSKSSGPPPPSGSSGSEAAAGAGAAAPASQHPVTGTGAVQTEAMKQILGVIDKKLRNLEKKKVPGVGGEGRVDAPTLTVAFSLSVSGTSPPPPSCALRPVSTVNGAWCLEKGHLGEVLVT